MSAGDLSQGRDALPADLIARLEGATEGSDELDCRITALLFPEREVLLDPGELRAGRPSRRGPLRLFPVEGWSRWADVASHIGARPYTTSLDAAVSLVPEGWVYTLVHDYGGLFRARLFNCDPALRLIQEDGATLPLALCVAALKARSAS